MEMTSSDGTRIHYELYGSGPTVVMAHGSLMEGASWVEAGYVDALAEFRCVVMDCRGYDSSDKPHDPTAYEVERYVDDIIAVANAVDADHFGIAGYSWGTAGGWNACARHPDRIAAFVAISGWHPNLYSFDREVMEATRIEPVRRFGIEGVAGYMKGAEGPLPDWWVEQVLACDPDAYIATRYAAIDWTRLPPAEVKVPTLLISGSEEDVDRDAMLVAGSLHDGEAVVVGGRGHCQTFLAPETLTATHDFLARFLLTQ